VFARETPSASRAGGRHATGVPHVPQWARAVAATLGLALILSISIATARPASAATHTFVVNSLAFGGPDAAAGDGACATAAGTCTLRAAIEESNALNAGAGEVLITVADDLEGNIEPDGSNTAAASNRPNWMYPTATGSASGRVSTFDVGGAFYHVTAPVTVDLDNRLSINDGAYNTSEGAAFYVDASDVTFTNVSQIFGSGSSFVMGPNASDVVIDGGATRTRASNVADRFITYKSGSRNITLRNYAVSGFNHYAAGTSANASRSGLLWFDSAANTTFTNYTVDNVLFDYPTAVGCSATDGTGCATSLIDFRTRNSTNNSIQVTGFTFKNSTVQNMPATKNIFAFPFGNGETAGNNTSITSYAVTLRDLSIVDNRFLDNRRFNAGSATSDPTKYGAFIVLPYIGMNGNNVIARNDFVRAEPGVVSTSKTAGLNPYAIYLQGNTSSSNNTTKRNLAITDNHFNGYAGQSTIRMYQAGRVTVARNTFGTETSSTARGSNLASGEETGTGTVMYANSSNSSNRKINTWYPTAASVVPSATSTCMAEVSLRALTGTANQTAKVPVLVDLYWTRDRTAEVYLGTYQYAALANQQVQLDLPLAGDERLRWIADPTGANVPVHPETGVAQGFVRAQTHSGAVSGTADGDLESSQYSRVAPLTGTCAPALTIEQAAGQNDPTLVRNLHFTITSSTALDESTLTADVVELTAAPTAATVDESRINPQVLSVTEVEGSQATQFTIVAQVDDSASVTAAVPPQAVASAAGIRNPAAATSRDAQITFVNPLTVSPATFTLVTGEPEGKEYALQVKTGAPAPAADLAFSATVDAVGNQYGVALSTPSPTIAAGADRSDPVVVTAVEGAVASNTRTTISHTVRSDDPNYDRLVVPSVLPMLFSTDPTIQIVKQAYVDVADTSSAERIVATGTEAYSDARLMDRQAVCFVYTVTNTSADDWATVLTDARVTDSDTRLGDNGLVGSIPVLGIGESAQVAACTSLLPVDTTVASDAS
jgi:adhesin/invasin